MVSVSIQYRKKLKRIKSAWQSDIRDALSLHKGTSKVSQRGEYRQRINLIFQSTSELTSNYSLINPSFHDPFFFTIVNTIFHSPTITPLPCPYLKSLTLNRKCCERPTFLFWVTVVTCLDHTDEMVKLNKGFFFFFPFSMHIVDHSHASCSTPDQCSNLKITSLYVSKGPL